ncbi:MAG: WYL domain-containing protein [Oscillibacter sp.]|nr:WYL domain-containing protein [Oscillibacter sp.]
MLFHEIYGTYFQVVSAVLAEAVEGTLTEKRLLELVREKAFAESVLTIPAALRDGSWPLLDRNLGTPIRRRPEMPLSTLEKRWLKALLLDPRIALFDPPAEGLEDVAPLFRPETFIYFDRYTDGDPYRDPGYIARFHTILTALREKRKLRIQFQGRTGVRHSKKCVPLALEYSGKDDKFRLLTLEGKRRTSVNLGRMERCSAEEPYDPEAVEDIPQGRRETLVLRLRDRRNALERALLHFSHFEKETVRLEEDVYRVTLRYQREDETELLIRVLSFGPMLRVTAPERMVNLVRQRVERQLRIGD